MSFWFVLWSGCSRDQSSARCSGSDHGVGAFLYHDQVPAYLRPSDPACLQITTSANLIMSVIFAREIMAERFRFLQGRRSIREKRQGYGQPAEIVSQSRECSGQVRTTRAGTDKGSTVTVPEGLLLPLPGHSCLPSTGQYSLPFPPGAVRLSLLGPWGGPGAYGREEGSGPWE